MNSAIKNLISFTKPFQLKLSVIIINFNVKYFLEQCLCSVTKACKNIEAEIFVIDNLSTDSSKEYFNGKFKEVTFIWNTDNGGFSKANNQALKLAKGDFILFLNPDTILAEDCLEKCIGCLQNDDGIGALGIKMIDGGGNFLKESKRGFPSPFISLCKLSGLTDLFPRSKIFARYYQGHLDENITQEADVLSGAFMMVRKPVLDKTDGFDERFFMYGEDIDLSYRIQQAGYKNLYFAATTIIHFKGESTRKASPTYIKLFYGAMTIFVKKHYGGPLAWSYRFLIHIAIRVKTIFSQTSTELSRQTEQTAKLLQNKTFLIIGDRNSFALVQSVLEKYKINSLIYREEAPMDLTENFIEDLENLTLFLKDHFINEIVFCINDFSAKETIALIEALPKGYSFRFHFAGTHCIVGSNQKDSSGDIIA